MKVFNSLKEMIFRTPETRKEMSEFQMLNSYTNTFSSFSGKLFESDLIQSAIGPYVNHISKLAVRHIRNEEINPYANIRFLLTEPNELMTMQQLISKTIWDLKLNGNAYIHITYQGDTPYELHVLTPNTVEVLRDNVNQIYLRMYFANGTVRVIPYRHIIHLRGNRFAKHDFFGDNPVEALVNLMDILHTTETGIKNAIKNSAVIRWLLEFKQALKPDDIERQTKKIQEKFMSLESDFGGIVGVDAKYALKQVKNENALYIPDNHVQNNLVNRVHQFFGVSKPIIESTYTEDEFNAWWEAECSPIVQQLSEEFTRKLFTRTQRGHGNKIVFDTGSFLFASYKTKLQLTQLVDRSAMGLNEYREILGLSPLEEDKWIIRREYGELNEVTMSEDADGNLIRVERARLRNDEGGDSDESENEE